MYKNDNSALGVLELFPFELKYYLLLDAVSFSLSVDEIMIYFFIRIVILSF